MKIPGLDACAALRRTGQAGENLERVHVDIVDPMLRVAAENNSGKGVREIMTDDMHKLSMCEMCNICEGDSIKLHTTAHTNV